MNKNFYIREGERIMQAENRNVSVVEKTVKTGISFGSALAMVISYMTWKSIGWAILHGILSWIYVVYFIFKYGWS